MLGAAYGQSRLDGRHGSSSYDEGRSIDESLLKKLERKSNVIMQLMDDAEERQFANPEIKQWLVDVKHAIYDRDTLLDMINTEAQFKELYGTDGSFFHTLQDANSKVKEITEELVDLAEDGGCMGLKPCDKKTAEAAKETQVSSDRLTTSVLDESAIVYGREEEKQEIMEQVLSSCGDKVGVIAIIGVGGLGKSTLAQFVYNHPDVIGCFNKRSWACVSDNFDLLRVTKDIFESLTERPASFHSLDTMQQNVKEELRGKTFLIVLDDVWELSNETLKKLMAPFSCGMQGSKIMVTTRDQRVASAVFADYRLQLKPMSKDEGWFLFSDDVFQAGDLSHHSKLEVIGRDIVGKCKGLPLAIKTLGCLLRSEMDEMKWKGILESNFWQLPEDQNDIVPALKLSYSYLPSHLKTCFAYCSIFPKGYLFKEEALVNLWIDEGFVKQSNDNTHVEDVGKAYFTDLLSRSFFTAKNSGEYVMHDVIHDLCPNGFC